MEISAKMGNIAFYALVPSLGFFVLSVLTWKSFYIVEAQFPNIKIMAAQEYSEKVAPIYCENYVHLAITIICLLIAFASVFMYTYSNSRLK